MISQFLDFDGEGRRQCYTQNAFTHRVDARLLAYFPTHLAEAQTHPKLLTAFMPCLISWAAADLQAHRRCVHRGHDDFDAISFSICHRQLSLWFRLICRGTAAGAVSRCDLLHISFTLIAYWCYAVPAKSLCQDMLWVSMPRFDAKLREAFAHYRFHPCRFIA